MDMPMNLAAGNMLPYLHLTPGDTVWFIGWVPTSAGAMVGTCIGLFMLSIVERWVAVCLELAEQHWTERTSNLIIGRSDDIVSPGSSTASSSLLVPEKFKWGLPPFVPEFDITRGVLFTAQKFLQILLMLTVMTFQFAFVVSIAIGSGVGEVLFGRFLTSSHEH
ncbi:CTR copper uptake transporter, partial [Boletus edulis]